MTDGNAGKPPEGDNGETEPTSPFGQPRLEDLFSSSEPEGETPSYGTSSFDHGRFLPGTLLAERYRIVGLLGKGGMGEVYRADDLKLGQTVALKFLPEGLANNEAALRRFHNEVRLARQVSHPNVCRVYDIGEAENYHFLSMEYVDGEDLASLLKRIGRFSSERACEVARQLCLGLAAAHGKGVLHRDLKPANVMINASGTVVITDFGLAALAGQIPGEEARAGTPAYMAPEQFTGTEVSTRSDIYALGLILYEVFTGMPAFKASSLTGLVRDRDQAPTPSDIITDLDPAVESVILRCLEKDPQKRPPSAVAVMQGLPGGDPLAATLAAGETPSPELVAASGGEEGLEPRTAIACFAALLIGLAVAALFCDQWTIIGHTELPKPPVVLADSARTIIGDLGYDEEYFTTGWFEEPQYRHYDQGQAYSLAYAPGRKRREGGTPIYFWYRQSPSYLVPQEHMSRVVTLSDPPFTVAGMASVCLDMTGRLLEFRFLPPPAATNGRDIPPIPAARIDTLFTRAGLTLEDFDPLGADDPQKGAIRLPVGIIFDTCMAWKRKGAEPISVLAAVYRERPVYFRVMSFEPVTEPGLTRARHVGLSVRSLVVLAMAVVGIVLARRNLKRGRCDRRGAFRLALFACSVAMLGWELSANHVQDIGLEGILFVARTVPTGVIFAFVMWLFYLALEPYVRRLWPGSLITWTRVLAGRFREPRLGRDILLGTVFAAGGILLQLLLYGVSCAVGKPLYPSTTIQLSTLLGGRHVAAAFCSSLAPSVSLGLSALLFLFICRVVFRRQYLAALFFVLFWTASMGLAADHLLRWIWAVYWSVTTVILLTRFGPVAFAAFHLSFSLLSGFPVTSDTSAWYFSTSILALAIVAGLGAYGLRISLAGRPLLLEKLVPQ